MKKKIVFITLVVALMSCLLILTACGQVGFSGGDASISDDYNSQEVQAKMETMKNGDGFKFVFEGTGTGAAAGEADTVRFTYGAKGNIYYMATDGEETYWDLSGETSFAIYTKEVGDDNNAYWTKSIYSYTEDYTKEDAKQQLSLETTGVLGWMTYYGTASFDGG
ncbi:MAG: hypothetical protein K5765_07265, partial [Clostridia bacterium]|nr:hypothetical protein [Clostridia bacterium]